MDRTRVALDTRAGLRRPVDALRLLLPASTPGRLLLAPFLLAAAVFTVFVVGSMALAVVESATGWTPTTLDASGVGADDAWVMGFGVVSLGLVHLLLAVWGAVARGRSAQGAVGR